MKRQKIFVETRQTMYNKTFASTERDDGVDAVQKRHWLSSAGLQRACLTVPTQIYVNYWVR